MKLNKNVFLLLIITGICSSTLIAQKTGKGWTNLFDGKTLKGWHQLTGTATYTVEGGVIVGTTVAGSPNSFLATEKEYGDFILEVDIKLESQQGNSGVQTRSHFDPAGRKGQGLVYGRQVELDPSDRKWSGGIYDEGRRLWLYPLTLNTKAQNVYRADDFNHYRIECIGNEMRTWLNGTPVSYLVDTIDKKGFIALQVHSVNKPELAGKRVWFKNIRIQTNNLKPMSFPKGIFVVNYQPNSLTAYEKKDGWRLLFDGRSSNGWMSFRKTPFPAKGWVIKDGTINVLPSEGKEAANGGDIVTKEEFSAFDLSFEYKLSPGANSGVKYFVTLTENNSGSAIGLEYQVLDDSLHPDAKAGRDGNRTLASLYDLIKANKPAATIRPIGAWNTGRIVVYPGNKVEHYINGIKVLEYVRGSKEYRDLVAISKYNVWKNFGEAKQGHILLQDHGNAVSYRSIKIKTL
ncbi:MAG TPA: DUF1080 domain-containing protein [Chitinophagaceae bacterium]|nr:DUF1080 domain-containing protein [Chitinophagaceae bacterium]